MRESPLEIEITIRVTDDSFLSRLTLPVDSTPEQRETFGKLWVEGMASAFRVIPAKTATK